MEARRVILGRAGAGKTRRLTDRVAAAIREGRGGGTLLLVPTLSQANHLKRLLLSRYPALTGFYDENVVTFTSLAERICPETPIRELLSGRRQDLLLVHALEDAPPAAFAALARYPGFRRAALLFVKELKQNGLPAPDVARQISEIAEARPGAARERLLAFRDLFLAYESRREAAGLLDHEDSLVRARDALRAGRDGLDLGFVGIDGFQNFTRLERELLTLLSARAEEFEVTLPCDPSLPEPESGPFAVVEETLDFLRARDFEEVVLSSNRRARTGDLAHLEQNLFRPGATPREPDGSLLAFEGADDEDEADRVARRILGLVLGGEYAWRDIVVVVREAGAGADRFRHAFARHRIPLRVYATEDLGNHPLVRAVRSLLHVASGEFTRESLLPLLRSRRLAGVVPDAVDRLEFDLLEHGEPGSREEWIERVRGFSPAGAALLEELSLPAGELPPAEMAERILALAGRAFGPGPDPAGGEPERIRREGAAAAAFTAAAEQVAESLAWRGEPVSARRFVDRLLAVSRELGARPRDRRLNVVNLIDAREARQWEAPVVFVAGLVEGRFPVSPREDVFLAERDRRYVNDRGGISVRERALERQEERYLFYVALTRARDRLHLSWPATDGKGEETLPSLYLREALSLFVGGESLVSRRRLSEALPRPEETADREDVRRRALLGLADPYRPGTPGEARAREAVAMHDLLVGAEGGEPDPGYLLAVRLAARFYRPPAGVLAAADRLPVDRVRSASALEDFAQCPYRHFAGRILHLAGPPRSARDGLDALLLGEISHEVLRRVFLPALEPGRLPDPEEVEPRFEEVWSEKAAGVPPGLAVSRARRTTLRSLVRLVVAERERLDGSGWRPAHLEEEFRIEVEGVPVGGRVDRIDAGPDGKGVVIDYKASRGYDAAAERGIADGVKLQLPLYLLALLDGFDLVPSGAWLYPVKAAHPSGYAVGDLRPGGRKKVLEAEDLDDLLARTRARVAELDRGIRSGDIGIRPHDPELCSRCEFADVCRIEPWMAGAGEEEA